MTVMVERIPPKDIWWGTDGENNGGEMIGGGHA